MLSRLIEANEEYRAHIINELERDKEALKKYWSDSNHLEDKLHQVAGTIRELKLLTEEQMQDLAIQSGTGSVVMKQEDGQYHYVEVNMPGRTDPLYIAPKATLPPEEIPNLWTLGAFTLTSR